MVLQPAWGPMLSNGMLLTCQNKTQVAHTATAVSYRCNRNVLPQEDAWVDGWMACSGNGQARNVH